MTNQTREQLLRIAINHRMTAVYPARISPNLIERDKRKQAKELRETVAAGYLRESGGEYFVTDKIFDELAAETIDLAAIWERDRQGWNRDAHAFIRFNLLTAGQKKTALIDCGRFQWFVCNVIPLDYRSPVQDGDLLGPVDNPAVDLNVKTRELRTRLIQQLQRVGNFPEVEIVLRSDELTAYVEKTLDSERFNDLYLRNLEWGLVKTGAASAEDAAEVVAASGSSPFVPGGTASGLGVRPEEWGASLEERITNTSARVDKLLRQVAAMRRLRDSVVEMGGWDVFREKYRSRLEAELAKEKQEPRAPEAAS